MAFKFVAFAALVAVARAGDLGYGHAPVVKYSDATAVSYSSLSAPVVAKAYSHAAPSYSHAAPVYSQAAPVYSHAAPVYSHAAPVYSHAAPVYGKAVYAEAPAHYDFSYSVNDPHTGDSKHAQESRKGDAVHGSYSLVDADGFKRTVEYTADEHNGFNAVVHREPIKGYAAPVAHAPAYASAPAYAHAPVYAKAPVYAAPAYNHHY